MPNIYPMWTLVFGVTNKIEETRVKKYHNLVFFRIEGRERESRTSQANFEMTNDEISYSFEEEPSERTQGLQWNQAGLTTRFSV